MDLCNGSYDEGDCIDDLNGEKERNAEHQGNGGKEGKTNKIIVECPFCEYDFDARAAKDCVRERVSVALNRLACQTLMIHTC